MIVESFLISCIVFLYSIERLGLLLGKERNCGDDNNDLMSKPNLEITSEIQLRGTKDFSESEKGGLAP